jgi:hypothetical protein
MIKYGNDYYVSFTMFWRALISLVTQVNRTVSVTRSKMKIDMIEGEVLCRMGIARLWSEMPGNRV